MPVPLPPHLRLPNGARTDLPGMGEEETHLGFTTDQVVERAVEDGSLEAWEWLQAWWNASIEGDEAHDFYAWMQSGERQYETARDGSGG